MAEDAQRQLQEAIENAAKAYGITRDEEFVGDWALGFHVQGMDLLETDRSVYGHMFKDGQLHDHVAEGLYRTGIQFLSVDIPERE